MANELWLAIYFRHYNYFEEKKNALACNWYFIVPKVVENFINLSYKTRKVYSINDTHWEYVYAAFENSEIMILEFCNKF